MVFLRRRDWKVGMIGLEIFSAKLEANIWAHCSHIVYDAKCK